MPALNRCAAHLQEPGGQCVICLRAGLDRLRAENADLKRQLAVVVPALNENSRMFSFWLKESDAWRALVAELVRVWDDESKGRDQWAYDDLIATARARLAETSTPSTGRADVSSGRGKVDTSGGDHGE